MTTDPISDMLIQLKNASRVGKLSITVPFSGIKLEIAKVRTLVELEDWTALYAYLDLAREQRESWFAEWSRRKQPR